MSDSIVVKVNGNILKKQSHMFQISVRNLHRDIFLPVSQKVFHGSRNKDGRVCIGDNYLINYTQKQIKPMNNRNI